MLSNVSDKCNRIEHNQPLNKRLGRRKRMERSVKVILRHTKNTREKHFHKTLSVSAQLKIFSTQPQVRDCNPKLSMADVQKIHFAFLDDPVSADIASFQSLSFSSIVLAAFSPYHDTTRRRYPDGFRYTANAFMPSLGLTRNSQFRRNSLDWYF